MRWADEEEGWSGHRVVADQAVPSSELVGLRTIQVCSPESRLRKNSSVRNVLFD